MKSPEYAKKYKETYKNRREFAKTENITMAQAKLRMEEAKLRMEEAKRNSEPIKQADVDLYNELLKSRLGPSNQRKTLINAIATFRSNVELLSENKYVAVLSYKGAQIRLNKAIYDEKIMKAILNKKELTINRNEVKRQISDYLETKGIKK